MATAPIMESTDLPWEVNAAPHDWDVSKPEIYA